MKKNTNIFERIIHVADSKGIKNVPDLANFLGYDSAEKLYRLKRDPEAKPSVDIVIDFTNKFDDLNLRWFLTGKGNPFELKQSMYDTSSEDGLVNEPLPTYQLNLNKGAINEVPNNSPLVPKVVTVDHNNNEVIALVPYKAIAGYLNGYADPEFIENLPSFSLPGFAGHSHRAFEVRGQSMLPTHHSGSIAIGRSVESLDEIRDRRVYIVVTKADGIVLKRVLNRVKQDGKLILMSDNDNKTEYPNYPIDPEEVLELWYWRGSIIRESPEPGNLYHRINDMEAKLSLLQHQVSHIGAQSKMMVSK